MNILVFDIETIPDTKSAARLFGLTELKDEDIAKAMATRQLQKTGSTDFLPLHLHKIVAISALHCTDEWLKIGSLGEVDSSEKELIDRFYNRIERYSPTLVSWNGSGFDLPVLHYRSLLHGVNAKRYWEVGEHEREFRFNNYVNRYHWRHTDLMDILAGFNLRASAPMEEIAVMLGFPGKLGMHGHAVWDTFLQGDIAAIRKYCETDVLNTYLIYLRWQMVRGRLAEAQYSDACEQLRATLTTENTEHFQRFIDAWDANKTELNEKTAEVAE